MAASTLQKVADGDSVTCVDLATRAFRALRRQHRLGHANRERRSEVGSPLASVFGRSQRFCRVRVPCVISWRARDAFLVTSAWALTLQTAMPWPELTPSWRPSASLVRMNPAGGWSSWPTCRGYEGWLTPTAARYDSNPYAVFSAPGRKRIVADAGGNDLLQVTNDGHDFDPGRVPRHASCPIRAMFGGGEGPAAGCAHFGYPRTRRRDSMWGS